MQPHLTLAVLGSLLVTAVAHPAGVSILEKDGRSFTGPNPPPPYARLLADNGFALGFPPASMRETAKLSPELVRQFNVVVVPTLLGWTTDMKPAQLTAILDDYLQAGGGVLVFQLCFLEGVPQFEAVSAWLARYGAALRWEELTDDEHKYADPPAVPWQAPHFYWTDNIAAHPLTRDVKTLFYVPGLFRGPYMTGLNVDDAWQVLASTAATTRSHKLTLDKAAEYPKRLPDEPGVGAVPLLAVRTVGKGRLAVFGGSPAAYWFDLCKPVYAGVPQERGDGQRRSDWLPLLLNVLRWLGEPGNSTGTPGGYQDQVQFCVQPDWGNRTPIDWDTATRDGVSPELVQQALTWHSGVTPEDWRDWEAGAYRPYKVLIGARSRLSGGKGSVADWKAAALAAGYSAVVFRESILALDEAQWQAFTRECQAASGPDFRALPGQEFEDWIGNRFFRFTGDLKYPPHKERLADNGKVRDQLSWFFDVGWPVNLPLSPKTNPTEFWNYRVYDAWPIQVFAGGQPAEDNRREWEELVDNCEYPSPVVLHLLDDPAQVAAAATQANTFVLAKALPEFTGNQAGSLFGNHNNPRVYSSTGPVIDRFHALNMYRTTLGHRGVPGSYRYRVFVKAHAARPIARVELWGGNEALRVYRPNSTEFSVVTDEQHDRQRGLWLKVVDAAGGEACATGIMVHDKMLWFVWCGDHCNALPAGLGQDAAGNVMYYGVGTRVKSSFQGLDGPAVSGFDMWRYVPWGTDTSAPAVGTMGQVRLFTADGRQIPDAGEWYTSRVNMPYGTRDIMVERLTAIRVVRWQDYVPKHQATINGWYPYTRNQDLASFTVVHEDADLHRDALEPALQWNAGRIGFRQDLTLSDKEEIPLLLATFNTNVPTGTAYTAAGELAPGTTRLTLGKGGYLTWAGQMGNVTVFGLDEAFALRVTYDGRRVVPSFGYALPGRQFHAGDTLAYQMLIMRWPSGVPFGDRLDVRVAAALNLDDRQPAYTVTPSRGRVTGTQLFLSLEAQDGAFAGKVSRAFLGCRLPARITGLNPRWTAAVWRPGVDGQVLAPLVPRAASEPAYFSLDLATEAGALFIGHLVTASTPELWVRVFQRQDGGFDVVAHNPGETAVNATLRGVEDGPLSGWTYAAELAPGAEARCRADR